MASRIRSGKRTPSAALAMKIGAEFGIPEKDNLRALGKGAEAYAKLVKKFERLAKV